MTILADSVFESCRSLKSVNIDKIKVIGSGSFAHCESLQTVKIKDGVKIIGESAFLNSTKLENINIVFTLLKIRIKILKMF